MNRFAHSCNRPANFKMYYAIQFFKHAADTSPRLSYRATPLSKALCILNSHVHRNKRPFHQQTLRALT
jgi:hypothetical protein